MRVDKNNRHHDSMKIPEAGLTVLEVILAIVILTIASTTVLHFLLAGDKIYGRNILIENAAQLARNEAEFIKVQAPVSDNIEDSEYEREVNGRSFFVKRRVLESEEFDSLAGGYPLKLVVLQVIEGIDSEKPITTFKFIQGYNIKQ